MTWWEPVDIYCERTDPAFWSEPFNAVSNLAFLIAAFAAARHAADSDRPAPDRAVLALSLVVAIIGVGSFLFHTFANRWSALADVIPIAVFIHAYLFLALRRFFGLSWPRALVGIGLYLAFSTAVEAVAPRDFLNGSAGYLPAWAAMLVIGAILRRRNAPEAGPILAAGAVFTASLAFRSSDQAICDAFPLGVHYLWHMLNALTLYLLLGAALRGSEAAMRGPTSGSAS